jgi:Ca-activated chloride channel family protein
VLERLGFGPLDPVAAAAWLPEWRWPAELELGHPWFLLLALPGAAIFFWRRLRKGFAPALVYPSVRGLKGLPRTLRQRLAVAVPVLEGLAVLLLVGAAARPRRGDSRTVVKSEGIAIQMVLDVSGSMEEKLRFEGRERRKIDIVKGVFRDFVSGNRDRGGDLPGRKTDLIGLTTFARFTEENCPLIGDHEQILAAVERLEPVPGYVDKEGRPIPNDRLPRRQSDVQDFLRRYGQPTPHPMNATAIGDGLMRAVLSMVTAEEDLARAEEEGGYKIKGKVIILLTDGENNAGDQTPIDAGRYAAENGIRVYYVLLRERFQTSDTFFGRVIRREIPLDELLDEPRKVAGDPDRAFLAEDGDALRRIYAEIDEFERTEIGRIEYRSYNELYHWLLLPGFGSALVALLLAETLFRRTP